MLLRNHGRALFIAFVCWILAPTALAVEFPDKPARSDFFVDQANLLNDSAKQSINNTAGALLKEEAIPIYVVTIPSLSAYDAGWGGIERYATKLFDHWGIGSQDRNYGMLLLVSSGDRKARIELGAGFDHQYDGAAKDVMQSLIIPAFKRGDYATGISDGVRGLDAIARGLQLPKPTAPWWFIPALIAGAIFLGLLIFNLFKSGRKGWAWALIAFLFVVLFFLIRNAGSAGFGGGSGGGGGATGSW